MNTKGASKQPLYKRLCKEYGKGKLLFAWSAMLITMALYGVFMYYPIIRTFISSTYQIIANESVFVGLKNFDKAFHDKNFLQSIVNTLYFIVLRVPVGMIFSFLLALAINGMKNKFVSSSILGAVFVPTITSMVAWALIFKLLYNPTMGPINLLLGKLNISGPAWLGNPKWIMPSLALMDTWKHAGYQTLLLYSGLQTIPQEYSEAAIVDGCNSWTKFWKITFPLMMPVTSMVAIVLLINCVQIFVPMFVLFPSTSPGNAASTIGTEIYRQAFSYGNMGYAGAISVILFVMIFICTLINLKITKTDWEY